jgi:hypothetical protein
MNDKDSEHDHPDEAGVSWLIVGVIIVIFLCFTIIPALIFFLDRSPPVLDR